MEEEEDGIYVSVVDAVGLYSRGSAAMIIFVPALLIPPMGIR